MVVVVALTWLAALYRLRITLPSPHRTLWRSTFTLAVVLLAVTATAFGFPGAFDALLPNLANLVWHLASSGSAGCVVVYLLTLTNDKPRKRSVQAAFGSAGLVAIAQLVLWLLAPIHDQQWGDLAQVPPSLPLLLYFLCFYGYLAAVLPTTAVMCLRLALRPDVTARSARIGLAIIAASTALAGAAIFGNCARFIAEYRGSSGVGYLRTFGNIAAVPAIGGIALGTILFIVGPKLSARISAWRTIGLLSPLHDALVDQHPAISVSSHEGKRAPHRVRMERMVIEIHDALHRTQMPPPLGTCPYQAISRAVRGNQSSRNHTVSASSVLPDATTRTEEHLILMTLARTFNETVSHA